MNFTTYINETKAIEYAVHDVDELLHAEELPDAEKPVDIQSKDIQLHHLLPGFTTPGQLTIIGSRIPPS